MTTTSSFAPDLTGVNPDYAVTNDQYVIFEAGQSIEFSTTVFFEGLTLVRQGTVNVPLVYGTDWIYTTADIDVAQISKMKTINGTFNAILLKSIEIVSPYSGTQYTIVANYQQLYPLVSSAAAYGNTDIIFTPDVLIGMLSDIQTLLAYTRPVTSVAAITSATPKLLAEDLTGTASANRIQGEIHTVNTLQGQNVIFPVCGPFYADSVSITVVGSSTPLVVGTDYQCYGMDRDKTKITESTSEVCTFILMSNSFVGNVSVNYQAFGGIVSVSDIQSLAENVQSVTDYLNNFAFVTSSNLASTPTMVSILSRLSAVEDKLRVLINSGNPDYSDASGIGGVGIALKIRSTDTNLHWWTIAELYKVAGSSQVVVADRMHFRMQFNTTHLSMDVYANVDLNQTNPLILESVSVNQDVEFTPFGAAGVNMVVAPQFRIIWNTVGGSNSGILLQIGMPLPSLTETIGIQDVSGAESCWILNSAPSTAVLPQDTNVTLPDGVSVWTNGGGSSQNVTKMMPNKTGYLAWSGSVAVQSLVTGSPLTTSVPVGFRIQDMTSVVLNFSNGTKNYPVTIPVASNSDGSLTGCSVLPSAITGGSPSPIEVTVSVGSLIVNAEIGGATHNLTLLQAVYKV